MKQLIECVPNISEGQDTEKIKLITDVVETVEGVKLLDVDPGKATNRTVITFVGEPEKVIEAAFLLIKKASELIDMTKHSGEHPRMGATDVCPLVPVAGISMQETADYARKLGKRVGEELGIPVYLYEAAAASPQRKNLSNIRAGEYEGLAQKIVKPEWKPDFGPAEFNSRSGATVIGARNFLIAYNVNLNTTSTRRANAIAFDIREAGRKIKNEKGIEIVQPGSCKGVKAIGWFIEEYGIAQVSINITDVSLSPVHKVFEECCKSAEKRGLRVTGSELVGLIPLNSLLDAGKHFLKKQQRSTGISEKEIIKIAVKSLGLDDLKPFVPEERVIEFKIAGSKHGKLVNMSLTDFADETASESPAPGGGSISAYVGALGISLGTMVANLSSHKKGWDERWEEFSEWAEKGQKYKHELMRLVDEDTAAFNKIMAAFGFPNSNEKEKSERKKAIQAATKYATEIPFKVMENAFNSMEVIKAMAEVGNPNSVSDAGVGALCARTAVYGAYLNVKINAGGLEEKGFADEIIRKGSDLLKKSEILEKEILEIVDTKISK